MNLCHDIYIPNCDFYSLSQIERCEHINLLTNALIRCDNNVRQIANYIDGYVQNELDNQRHAIYKVLSDYKYVDISEEEFIKILKEDY